MRYNQLFPKQKSTNNQPELFLTFQEQVLFMTKMIMEAQDVNTKPLWHELEKLIRKRFDENLDLYYKYTDDPKDNFRIKINIWPKAPSNPIYTIYVTEEKIDSLKKEYQENISFHNSIYKIWEDSAINSTPF